MDELEKKIRNGNYLLKNRPKRKNLLIFQQLILEGPPYEYKRRNAVVLAGSKSSEG